MQKISSIIDNKKFKPQPRALKHEWQAFAYKIWMDYDGNKKNLPQVIRFVKLYHEKYRPFLDTAYNFCLDYSGRIPKIRLFYWKFHQLLKEYNARTRRYLTNYYQGTDILGS